MDVLAALIPLVLQLIEAFLPLVPLIIELAEAVLPPLVAVLALVIETLTPLIVLLAETLVSAIETLTPFIEGLVVFIAGIALAVLNAKDTWIVAWAAIKAAFETALRGIVVFYNQTLVPLWNGLTAGLGVVKKVWDRIWGAISSGFAAFIRPITRAIDGILTAIRKVLNAFDKVRNFKLPDLSGLVSKIKIPGFAEGVRNFAGGAAVVGERGPELLNLPRGSNVTPMAAGAGGGSTTVSNNYYILTIEDFQKMVNEARTSFGRRGN